MNRSRRDFMRAGAVTAAGLLAGSSAAVAERRTKKRRRGRGKGEAGADAPPPRAVSPSEPLKLPQWRYGNSSTADDTVLMFRGNPAHTFYGTGPIPDKPRLKWKYRMTDFQTTLRGKPTTWSGTGWTGTAVKLGDYVFVGSVGRFFYALEAMTGKLAWSFYGVRMFKSSPCIYRNRIYVGNVDDRLRCIDAATGKLVWQFNTKRDLDSSPCVVDGRLYIAGENGYARCLDPDTGQEIWKTFLGGIGPGTLGGSNGAETSPAVADGELYAATYDGDLFCVDIKSGDIK
ncbi:MAG: PQQ-binding-like beta-propeller repeat protein, partial [Myxococcota bacterium]